MVFRLNGERTHVPVPPQTNMDHAHMSIRMEIIEWFFVTQPYDTINQTISVYFHGKFSVQ
jgi:hypothetical protein